MDESAVFARLVNRDGELIAEGPCYLDEAAGQAILEPQRSPGAVHKERGTLALELDSGRSLRVSDKAMIMQYRAPGSDTGASRHRRIVRLRLLPLGPAQDAETAGAVGDGTLTAPVWGRPRTNEETPAAR